MRKYLLSLGTLALVLFGAVPALASTTVKGTVNLTCMANATKTRDTATIAAWNTYSASISSALTARMNAANAAWVITNKATRQSAFRTLTTTYKNAVATAKLTLKNAKNVARNNYSTTAKTCGSVTVTSSELMIDIDTTL